MAAVIVALLILYLANQLFSNLFVLIPVFLIDLLPNLGQVVIIILLVVTLSWFFGE